MNKKDIFYTKMGDFTVPRSDNSVLQNHLEYILESSNENIYCKSEKGLYLTVNQTFLETYQWRSDNIIIGYSDFDLFNEKAARGFSNNDKDVMCSGKPKLEIEYCRTLDNDIERYFLSYKIPLHSRTGKIIGTLGQSVLYENPEVISRLDRNVLFPNLSISPTDAQEILLIQLKFKITKRQAECLYYLFKRKTTKQIAKALNLSYRTIDYYIENLKIKFQCASRNALIEKLFYESTIQ